MNDIQVVLNGNNNFRMGTPVNGNQFAFTRFSNIPVVLAEINWNSALGTSDLALSDGNNENAFDTFYCFSTRADVMQVITGSAVGWTATPNVMQITSRGQEFCGDVEWSIGSSPIPESTSHYGRFYFRVEEGFLTNHGVSKYKTSGVIEIVPFALNSVDGTALVGGRTTTNEAYVSFRPGRDEVGTSLSYPYNGFVPGIEGGLGDQVLDCDVWYRYEWYIEYLSATVFRLYPRIYNMADELLYDVNTFYPFNRNPSVESLQDWYDAGNAFSVVDTANARMYAVGYEGPNMSADTGAHFYKAALKFQTGDWVGPIT